MSGYSHKISISNVYKWGEKTPKKKMRRVRNK